MRTNIIARLVYKTLVPVITLTFLVGCGGDNLAQPTENLDRLYWDLRVDPGAALMTVRPPYNQLQLHAVAYAADGSILNDGDTATTATTWSSKDSSKVYVSSTGLVTALVDGSLTMVYVQRKIGKQTRIDSVVVQVTDVNNPPSVKSFSITPTDSLKRANINLLMYEFPPIALDADGNAINGYPVRWYASDPKIAQESYGAWSIRGMGNVQLSASSWIYGTAVRDSFSLEIGWPTWLLWQGTEVQQVTNSRGLAQHVGVIRTTDIGPGGILMFENRTGFGPTDRDNITAIAGSTIDIIFDDSTVALASGGFPGYVDGPDGNIHGLSSDTTLESYERTKWRRFEKPGIHYFTIQPYGVRGKITVHDR